MKFLGTALVVFSGAVAAHAGWIEQIDAGPFYQGGAYQETAGIGDLDTITGSSKIPGGVVPGQTLFRELVDVYAIRITDPAAFYATTDPSIDGRASASEDSRLFLLDPATGDVVLMNDNTDDAGLMSLIADPSAYPGLTGDTVHESAQNVLLLAGQVYLLAVTEYAITAIDLTGVLDPFETGVLLSADGAYEGPPDDPLNTNGGVPGGRLALVGSIRPATADSDWGSGLQFVPGASVEDGIDYVVALRGATYAIVPEPGSIALAGLVALFAALVAIRRKLG
jgi:hypothetical protein